MPVRVASVLCLAVFLLSGCAPFGETGFLSGPKLGKPTFWLIHKTVGGKVVDLSTCRGTKDTGECLEFRPSMCKPVAGAEVRLDVHDAETGKIMRTDTLRADARGEFVFRRKMELRAYGYSDSERNRLSTSGNITVSADGYKDVTERLYWGWEPKPFVISSKKLPEEPSEGHMAVILLVGEPAKSADR